MNPLRKAVIGGALVVSTMAGGAFGAALISGTASAASNTTTTNNSSSAPAPPANFDPTRGGHTANGITETLLTGADAAKAKAAALKVVPGGTVQRIENDAEGDAYEAHMLDANGNPVTVKFDKDFNVTKTETGGPGGPGHGTGA